MNRRMIFGLFVPLYMSQFLGIGFLFTGLVAISSDRGVSLEEIAGIYLIGMVWVVKFLWAPLVDRFGSRRLGHYRSWLLVTQPAAALAIVAITPLDVTENLGIILLALGFAAVMSATQDIATDALAVRLSQGRSRGGVNGLQVGANFIGDIIGGGLVLVVYDLAGWGPAILTLAAATALPALFVARFREPRVGLAAAQPEPRVRRSSAFSLFRQPGVPRWALVVTPLMVLGMPGAYGMIVPILHDSGMSVGLIGVLTNVFGGAVGIAAAIVAGLWVHRLGRKRSLVVFGLGQVVAIAATIPVATTGGLLWTIVAIVLLNIFNSAGFAAMYTINMDYARPTNAGSDFTIQVSISYFLRFASAAAIVGVAGSFGYTTALLACAVLALIGVAAAATLFTEPADRRAVSVDTAAPVPDGLRDKAA
jgi:MFS family permease